MPFSNDSARAGHPRYQEHRDRFSRHEVTAVQSWTHFGKIRKSEAVSKNPSKNVQKKSRQMSVFLIQRGLRAELILIAY